MDFLVEQREARSSAQPFMLKPSMRQLFTDQPIANLQNEKAREFLDVEYTGELKENSATLDTEKIKTADRVTFLLNYLFVVLKNNQLNWVSCQEQISVLREVFIASLTPYV